MQNSDMKMLLSHSEVFAFCWFCSAISTLKSQAQSKVMENRIGLSLFILEKMQAASGKYKFKFFNKKDWIYQSTIFLSVSHLIPGFLWRKLKNPYITLWKNTFSINKSAMFFFYWPSISQWAFFLFFRPRILISIPISFSISWKILLQCFN